MVVYTTQTIGIVVIILVHVVDALNIGLTERQVIIIHFSLQAMQKAHRKRPTFLNKRGITEQELDELLATLEDTGDNGRQKEKKTGTNIHSPYL